MNLSVPLSPPAPSSANLLPGAAPDWSSCPVDKVAKELGTDLQAGLSEQEVESRLRRFGFNDLPEVPARGAWRILCNQFCSAMVILLVVAALVSVVLGDCMDAGAIFAIVLLNAAFGFVQEHRAEIAIQALRKLSAPTVTVRSEGNLLRKPARRLVPGDILLLETGALVGADCRLAEAICLQINEAALTGESAPVEKSSAPGSPGAQFVERSCMAFQGTVVSSGRGTAVVTATGPRAELGRIAEMLARVEQEQTPLQRRLEELSRSLALVALAIVAVIFAMGLLRGEPAITMFLTAVSMAVAAVPEGLPAVVTIALAVGAQRMLRRRALIRRLHAAETLGAVTVICSDKTGTLTENRMTVTSLHAGGETYESLGPHNWPNGPATGLLLAAAALCNNAEAGALVDRRAAPVGDAMELALLSAATMAGVPKGPLDASLPRVAEVPFSAERKRMTTVHRLGGPLPPVLREACPGLETDECIAFMKGAVETVVEICDFYGVEDCLKPLAAEARTRIREASEQLAHAGQRVLAFAYRRIPQGTALHSLEQNFVFAGLIGLSDPTRPEVKAAVQSCRAAGIRPLMITGDHRLTAQHVARELGIGGRVVTGAELSTASPARLRELVEEASIYARVLPEHKLRIVEALQARGHVVSMTGDGVNDAPALKQADIGVAMGITGTDVSKQAADMVLLDDDFSTIVAAVEEGRAIYDNIRKFIRYVLAGNCGEILVMLFGPLCGLPLPLLPLQILWINLVTDGLNGIALSVEPPERDAMRRPPRAPYESIFAHGMIRHTLIVGTILALTALAIGEAFWQRGEGAWQTAVFLTLAFGQILQTFAARSWRDSIFTCGLSSNRLVVQMALASSAATLAIVYFPPLQRVFGTVPLAPVPLLVVLGVSTLVFWAIELEKLILRIGDQH